MILTSGIVRKDTNIASIRAAPTRTQKPAYSYSVSSTTIMLHYARISAAGMAAAHGSIMTRRVQWMRLVRRDRVADFGCGTACVLHAEHDAGPLLVGQLDHDGMGVWADENELPVAVLIKGAG